MCPVLKMDSIYKSICGIPILVDINLEVQPGEFHLLVGENGAGKSTLVQIICGLTKKDRGTVFIDGAPVSINSPIDAIEKGIVFMQQDSFLFDSMTIAENIYVYHRPAQMERCGILNKSAMNRTAQELLDRLGFGLRSTQRVSGLNLAQKRMVEIARLSLSVPRILILDEPLASLGAQEERVLLDMIREYRLQGAAVLYVSPQFSKSWTDVDFVTVLKDGHVLMSERVDKVSATKIGQMIWGRFYPDKYPRLDVPKGSEIFCVENLCAGRNVQDVSFNIAKGEILGIAGLVGSGRSTLAKAIFGQIPARSGTFYIDRLPASIRSPQDAIALGLAYITEDRRNDGLFTNLNVLFNAFSIKGLEWRPSVFSRLHATSIYRKYEKLLNIKKSNPQIPISAMSGGMQQKVLLMRWLLTDARLFIFDEPTRGVDIPSKVDIYNLMNDLIRKGGAIILISSDIEELAGMCDRILVMNEGRITHEACRDQKGQFGDIYRHFL